MVAFTGFDVYEIGIRGYSLRLHGRGAEEAQKGHRSLVELSSEVCMIEFGIPLAVRKRSWRWLKLEIAFASSRHASPK
jgi:hypothetical protein